MDAHVVGIRRLDGDDACYEEMVAARKVAQKRFEGLEGVSEAEDLVCHGPAWEEGACSQ